MQGGIPSLDLREHLVEHLDQQADLVPVSGGGPRGIVFLFGDVLCSPGQIKKRAGNIFLKRGGDPIGRQQGNREHPAHDEGVTLQTNIHFLEIGLDINGADPLSVGENRPRQKKKARLESMAFHPRRDSLRHLKNRSPVAPLVFREEPAFRRIDRRRMDIGLDPQRPDGFSGRLRIVERNEPVYLKVHGKTWT